MSHPFANAIHMRPYLVPIATLAYNLAVEQKDEIGATIIARLANERECVFLSTRDQLFLMRDMLQLESPHAEEYLRIFRESFSACDRVINGF